MSLETLIAKLKMRDAMIPPEAKSLEDEQSGEFYWLTKDATRRPQSRFAAAVISPPQANTAAAIIDEAIEQLLLLKRQIQRHAE